MTRLLIIANTSARFSDNCVKVFFGATDDSDTKVVALESEF